MLRCHRRGTQRVNLHLCPTEAKATAATSRRNAGVMNRAGMAGLRAVGVCQVLGTGVLPKHVEGMRVKLRWLVARG
jgi:hypothetical protein